jgi:hypothetical protein
MKNNVQCPHCQESFELPEKILNKFILSVRQDMAQELVEKELECHARIEQTKLEVRELTRQEINLNLLSKEKLITDLKDQLSKIRQKLEDGSQQTQGEVQELALESILMMSFGMDKIVPVAKGIKGADCTQHVILPNGTEIGTILYESKRTKTFSDSFITKLKKDNLQAKCSIAVIITATMPPSIKGKIGIIDGVWICQFESDAIRQLATVLRYSLLKIYQYSINEKDAANKASKLWKYVNSQEFVNLIENVLNGFKSLEQSYQDEKKKLTALWKIRELHLQEMLESTVELFTTMRGIHSEIPNIKMLEFHQAD